MGRRSNAEKRAVEFVNDLFKRELTRQATWHPRWYRNLSMVKGQQWLWWNRDTNQILELPRREAWHIRLTINRLRGIIWRVIAQVTRNDPRFVAVPVDGSERNRLAAQAWQDYLTYIWEQNKVRRLLRDRVLPWASIVGRGWLKVCWDPDAGNEREYRVPRHPDANEQAVELADLLQGGAENFDVERLRDGEVRFEAPSPFNILLDPAAESFDKARWLMEIQFCHVQEVEDTYGLKRGVLKPDLGDSSVPSYALRVLTGMKELAGAVASVVGTATDPDTAFLKAVGLYEGDDLESMVAVKHLWVAPTRDAPEGKYIIVANERALNPGTGKDRFRNPYGRIPFVPFDCFPGLGSTVPQGLIDDLYPLQTALNRTFSNHLAVRNLHRGPQWLVPRRTMVDRNAFNDRPTQIIPYEAAPNIPAPKRIDPPTMSFDHRADVASIMEQMEEVASLRPASRGLNPAGTRSNSALETMQAADEEGRAPMKERYHDGLTDTAGLVANVVKRFVREPRLMLIHQGSQVRMGLFSQADVEGCTDVRLSGEPGLPRTLMGRLRFIMGMAEAGLLSVADPSQRSLAFRLLGSADLQGFFDQGEGTERERIFLENQLLLRGMQVKAKPYDNHVLHADEHVRFMRSPEAQLAFQQNPELEQGFQQHLNPHINVQEGTMPPPEMASKSMSPPSAPGAQSGLQTGSAQPMEASGELLAAGGAG